MKIMKNFKQGACRFLAVITLLAVLSGCGRNNNEPDDNQDDSENFGITETEENPEDIQIPDFSFSEGIDENGFWEGVNALDYVELFNYQALQIPADIHTITEEAVQAEIDNITAAYPIMEQVFDRAVENGDAVNIDYVGSVDGVEFERGSTEGMGADVVIGVTSYIDDFLEQLIGVMPGETINVEVTFPDEYHAPDLQGKDAVFVTTVNYIEIPSETADITDAYVEKNLFVSYGWSTVEEMREGIKTALRENAIRQYIHDFIVNEVSYTSIPDGITRYQENFTINEIASYSSYYGMSIREFLETEGHSTLEGFIEANRDYITERGRYHLILQAVAEDMGFIVGDEDLKKYLDTTDYTAYAEQYGLPYLKSFVIGQKTLEFIFDNVKLL